MEFHFPMPEVRNTIISYYHAIVPQWFQFANAAHSFIFCFCVALVFVV